MFPTEHHFHQTNVNLNLFLENFTEKKHTQLWRKNFIKLTIGKMILQLTKQVLVGASMISINWFIQCKLQITKDLDSQTNNPTYFFEKDINKNELDHFMLDIFLWNDINKIYEQLISNLEKDLQKLELKKKRLSRSKESH
uniref:Uncharacterized protein n=1 Tax=Halamphora calidilacuna TaxID=2133758 RepID=A0A2R4A3N6_9STRA|nr:hypothetical protein [Halamphora calidilacuna]